MEFKNFTVREFNAASKELARIAMEFTKDGLSSSMSFSSEYTTLTIFDKDCKVMSMFSIHRQRFVSIESCKDLMNVAEKANVTLKGKHIQKILENLKKEDRDEGYMAF